MLKVPENFMRPISLGRFWFVHIPFGTMVKFSQFPVDTLSQPVMPSLVFLLRQFAFFAYEVIDCFIYVFVRSTLSVGGARGVMVIVVGNGHDDTSSNPGRDRLHFT